MQDPFFTRTILRWYAEEGRDLPWRRTRDPYAVWLSEIILQQTRIAQGTAYWERFMQRFPDVFSLAAADEDAVLRLWEGLGYYSRARNLLAAARQIAALGSFPDTLEGIRALKGVGDYTAAAIGSISFGIDAAVVDGNVYRVLSRYFGIETPVGSAAAKKEFMQLAQSLLPKGQAADFNQGMMDFGAVQCTPAAPSCSDCPLSSSCQAFRLGQVDRFPLKKSAPAVRTRYFSYIYVRCQGMTAFRRRPSGDIWEGLWEPLFFELGSEQDRGQFPDWVDAGALTVLKKEVRHVLTHQVIWADFYVWTVSGRVDLPADYQWVRESERDQYGKPKLVMKLLSAL